MTRTTIAKLGRTATRGLQSRAAITAYAHHAWKPLRTSVSRHESFRPIYAAFSTSSALSKPLSPEALKTAQPADITEDQYHKLADQYLDDILVKYEEEQDSKDEIDVDYSSGVMNIKLPHGTYVINKQPPNKQIWLSSPISGPKRYDYVITSEGQDAKQDTATGEWVYLRDGTSLTEILEKETGVSLADLDDA